MDGVARTHYGVAGRRGDVAGRRPGASMHKESSSRMTDVLTFGTISALFGLTHPIITPEQYSYLVMCLVDTPGLGSMFVANSATTRAFVVEVDAALVVVGTDLPISGEELELVEQVAAQVDHLANRHTPAAARRGRKPGV